MNPGRYGLRLAEYLQEQLPTRGVQTGEPGAEDWGYLLPIVNERFPIDLAIGNYEEYEDGFLCFLKPSEPRIRRWFRSIDTTADLERVAEAINQVLTGEPGIYGVRWWSAEESRGP